MKDDVRQLALNYLEHHQVMTLATVGHQGVWAAAVFYVNKGLDLFFLSAGHTRHAQNMHTNPKVAAAIHEDYEDWPAIKGIQLEGRVEELQGESRRAAMALYQTKYPFIAEAEPQIQTALTTVNWYRLSPERFYFIDNSRGFGHRDEIGMGHT